MQKVIRYAALVGFAVVASVLGLELTLQGAALVVGATGRDVVTGWISGNTRVLALGDSNTYGLFLPPEQSWPAQFEAIWNAEVGSPKIEVINLGYPGTNSSVLLNNLPGMLDTFRPDVVLIMIGVNDFWTEIVRRDDSEESNFDRASIWLRQHSRVFKLAYMVRRSFYDPAKLDLGERDIPAPTADDADTIAARHEEINQARRGERPSDLSDVRYGDRKFELGYVFGVGERGDVETLLANLGAIAEEVSRNGSQPLFLTYPSSYFLYSRTNHITRQAAQRAGVPLVDIGLAMIEHCTDLSQCPDLFFPDGHAKQPGYAIAARKLMNDLRASGPLADRH